MARNLAWWATSGEWRHDGNRTYDRYFLHVDEVRIEMPQAFFMRVAMGLALNEIDREARAVQFYNVLSSFDFMSSTPTLFNSGTRRSQLSSCYLTTVADDLDGIYEALKENALLSKFAGGLGNDWTRVRALGSHIKGTNGESQGVVMDHCALKPKKRFKPLAQNLFSSCLALKKTLHSISRLLMPTHYHPPKKGCLSRFSKPWPPHSPAS